MYMSPCACYSAFIRGAWTARPSSTPMPSGNAGGGRGGVSQDQIQDSQSPAPHARSGPGVLPVGGVTLPSLCGCQLWSWVCRGPPPGFWQAVSSAAHSLTHTNNNWQHPEQTLYAGERWLQMPLRCVPLPCIGTTDHELPQRGITLFWKKSWRKKHIKFFCWRYQIEYINQHFALLTCSGLYPVSSEPHCSARVGGPVVTLTPVVAARPWSSWWWPLSKVQIPSKKIIIIKNEMINTNE